MHVQPDFWTQEAFEIRMPVHQHAPFVFNSPHSGRYYPERFVRMSRLDGDAIRRSEDFFVDELFASAVDHGAPLMVANFPRAYLDVNREPYELDPKMFSQNLPPYANFRSMRVAGGLGTVPRVVAEGQAIYPGKLSLSEAMLRIDGIYKPYHTQLRGMLARTHRNFGYAVLIDCHSMPSTIRLGSEGLRPDFILGDRFGTSASHALTQATHAALSDLGYLVTSNKPYAGGFITEHYGRPAKGLHALQIEINRGLYFDEKRLRKKPGFDALVDDLSSVIARLVDMPSSDFIDYSLAAE
ncbi:MAG: N-formylglutamate amidohydrolase [Ahrensia sp.]